MFSILYNLVISAVFVFLCIISSNCHPYLIYFGHIFSCLVSDTAKDRLHNEPKATAETMMVYTPAKMNLKDIKTGVALQKKIFNILSRIL